MDEAVSGRKPPFGVEEAPCDDKWRIRLQKRYADYFLSFEPNTKSSARIYIATLNEIDAVIWPIDLFVGWAESLRSDTQNRAKNRELLQKAQFCGGETEVDRQGRFVLPRRVRDGLHLDTPISNLQLYNDGFVRLFAPNRKTAAPDAVAEVDIYALNTYWNYLSTSKAALGES